MLGRHEVSCHGTMWKLASETGVNTAGLWPVLFLVLLDDRTSFPFVQ